MGVVGVFIGANTSKKNVRHGRAFSTAAAQLGGFRATSGRRSECHLRWLGGVYGLWAPPFLRWVIYFPLGALVQSPEGEKTDLTALAHYLYKAHIRP